MWFLRVFGAYILGRVLGLGIYGVYFAMAADWSFRAVVFIIRYRKGKWEKMHVIET